MEVALLGEPEPNPAYALGKALRHPVFIVIDEAQRFFKPDSGEPDLALLGVLSFLKKQTTLRGRLLLLSDRLVERARWSEAFAIKTLKELSDEEAEQLLIDRLQAQGTSEAVPVERRQDLVRVLGRNPRAIETLVATLVYEPLDEIVGRDPGFWAIQDREVSRDFLEKLERELLERTIAHLDPLQHKRLLMLAAHRKDFESPAIELICGGVRKEWRTFRHLLVTRFLLSQRLGWHSLHPIVREIGLAHLRENAADFKQAHSKAANYHLRHFRARTMVDGQVKLAASFAERKFSLTAGKRESIKIILSIFQYDSEYRWVTYLHLMSNYRGTSLSSTSRRTEK